MCRWGVYSALENYSRNITLFAITTFLVAVFGGDLVANTLFEVGLNGGYTDNLLGDSSAVIDRYSVSTAQLRFYPTPKTEVNISGEAMYYDHNAGLSNRKAGLGMNYIPLNPESRLSIFLNAEFDLRRYRSVYSRYNNNNFDVRAAFGYRLGSGARFRVGVQLLGSEYLGSSSGDKTSTEAYFGFNTTVAGRNSLDCEIGYGSMDYRFIDPALEFIDFEQPEAALVGGRLTSFYVSPRLSRPLGNSTGLNLTFSYRKFLEGDSRIVYGSSVGLLSPWTSVWDGSSVILNIKSYLIPRFITSVGGGYWNRRHLQTIESNLFPLVIGTERSDEQYRGYLQLARPILIGGGSLLQPHFQIEFGTNNSTNSLFDYSSFSVSTGVSLRL